MLNMGGDTNTRAGGSSSGDRAELGLAGTDARVLVADGDGPRRAALLDELTQRMPERTSFVEAATVAQALELARESRMVVIGGPVHGASPGALARLLARRYPNVRVHDTTASRRRSR